MKKFLSFIVAVVLLIPVFANAKTSIGYKCTNADENGIKNCVVSYNITDDGGVDSLTVTLTEHGGAKVKSVNNASDSDWSVTSDYDAENQVTTVILVSPGVTGEGDLFNFSYQVSPADDCKISISLNNQTISTEEEKTPDTPTDNKDTGASLPYIALGAIAIVTAGAYISTKNKSKMYRI